MPVPLLLVVALAGAYGAAALTVSTESATSPPLPFDPPSSAEKDAAVATALADGRVQSLLGGHRHVALGAALRTDKVPGLSMAQQPRLLDVWFYDYVSDSVVWAVVDPTLHQVTETLPAPPGFQPGLAAAEVQRAAALAMAQEGLAARLPSGALPIAATVVGGHGAECDTNRCAMLAYAVDQAPTAGLFVLVNLSQDRVVKLIEGGWQEAFRS